MAADSRATAGRIADKHSHKVHAIADNMVACGAGTAADIRWVVKKIAADLKLATLNTGR